MAGDNMHPTFERTSRLYAKYQILLGQENVEVARKTLEEKIICEVCRIFYLDQDFLTYSEEDEGHRKKKENSHFSLEIFEKIQECLTYFNKQVVERRTQGGTLAGIGEEFTRYVTSSINKKLKVLKAQKSITDNSMMDIPREKIKIINKIKREGGGFSSEVKNKEMRIAQIKEKLGIPDDVFKTLYPYVVNSTLSLEEFVGSDEKSTPLKDLIEGYSFIEDTIEQIQNKQDLDVLFGLMQKLWEKSKDKEGLLSDILTMDILRTMFGSVHGLETNMMEPHRIYGNLDIFNRFSFFNQEMIQRYFHDSSYILPNQIELGQRYGGLSKSAVSKKLSRFYENVRKMMECNSKERDIDESE